ncbi:glycosyltransferase family 4 protein [Hymenobacter latericus]|uniref:glycosyltransferase family 4 protein n=1 Tax=Hymenobacter sp. YIM 151858-1 TaxID=2987688 RepID=UPI002227DDB4|nr:glycosyltransferase family 4 protein [Hymenobacter sp. YIM 151858-1]UYZ57453.1 glycosyltransferase family 4 protein [Hymenobacter sp. YIM 151858-1]
MKILFTTQALSIGGIEVLALRLSEAFAFAGHEVLLYDFNPERQNQNLVAQFDTTRFRLLSFRPTAAADWAVWKLHAAFFKTGLLRNFRPRLIERHFAKALAAERPDVICSLSFHQDYLACKHAAALGIPVVISMHGTYEYAAPEWPERAAFIYEHAKAIIYAADKNMSWYKAQPYYQTAKPAYKIYTGTSIDKPLPKKLTRTDLGISDEAFVFILVARGIPEKGWREAIEAFVQLRADYPNVVLLLVGEGEYLETLKQAYGKAPGVVFYGSHPNSVELVALANVGLLPSYFPIETLPNVIVDYLLCRLPVVASEIGEIPHMLKTHDGYTAGEVLRLPQAGRGVDVQELYQAMKKLVADPLYYRQQVARAEEVLHKFDIRDCVAGYTRVLNAALNA